MTNNQFEILSDSSESSVETGQTDPTKFYEDAKKYWSTIPPTVDGMLGGFGYVSDTDIRGSRHFLSSLFQLPDGPGRHLALDCGAGIGRITKHLLTPIFKEVDMVEQNPQFIQDSLKYIGKSSTKVRKQYVLGLQEFVPEKDSYDVIWCQWVLGHLKDDDLIKFLKDCIAALKPNGIIGIKENITSSNTVELDSEDSSVTRPHHILREIFDRAGLDCIKDVKQTNFPRGLYGVHMFAVRAKKDVEEYVEDLNGKLQDLSVEGEAKEDQA